MSIRKKLLCVQTVYWIQHLLLIYKSIKLEHSVQTMPTTNIIPELQKLGCQRGLVCWSFRTYTACSLGTRDAGWLWMHVSSSSSISSEKTQSVGVRDKNPTTSITSFRANVESSSYTYTITCLYIPSDHRKIPLTKCLMICKSWSSSIWEG